MEKIIKNTIYIFLILALLTLTQCTSKSASVANLPDNILGIKLGTNKEETEKHLKEIAKFSRDEPKRQQIWSLNNNPSYGYVAVGYDKENQVSYVAAFAKPKGGQAVRYDEIGDLKAARAEITEPNRRYVWEIPERLGNEPYSVTAQGFTPDHLAMLTIARAPDKDEEEEEEREKQNEKK